MGVYMIDLYRKKCKPVLKLDFTAHCITESLSEFGLGRLEKTKKSVKDGMLCTYTDAERRKCKEASGKYYKLKSLLIKSSIRKFASNLILFSYWLIKYTPVSNLSFLQLRLTNLTGVTYRKFSLYHFKKRVTVPLTSACSTCQREKV